MWKCVQERNSPLLVWRLYGEFYVFPRPSANKIITSVYRKPTHMDRYLDFNSNHPKSAKHAVVRALSDRAKNVCSSPELLAEEMIIWVRS